MLSELLLLSKIIICLMKKGKIERVFNGLEEIIV